MHSDVFNAVMNTVFVSIPECLVWIICILAILKRRDLLDIYRWKQNVKELMIPVLPVAITVNIMRYILHTNSLLMFLITEVMMCLLVIYLIKRNNFLNEKISYIKIILCVVFVDIIINGAVECLYALLLVIFMHLNITLINNNIYQNIILSLFPRAIQIIIIVFYLYKKNIDSNIKFFELIIKDKILSISLTTFIITLTIAFWIIVRFVLENSVFIKYMMIYQIIMNLLIISIPIILIISFLTPIYHLLVKNIDIQKATENMFGDDF